MKYSIIDSAVTGEKVFCCTSENMNEVPVLQKLLDRNDVGHVHSQGESVYLSCGGIVARFSPVLIAATAADVSEAVTTEPPPAE